MGTLTMNFFSSHFFSASPPICSCVACQRLSSLRSHPEPSCLCTIHGHYVVCRATCCAQPSLSLFFFHLDLSALCVSLSLPNVGGVRSVAGSGIHDTRFQCFRLASCTSLSLIHITSGSSDGLANGILRLEKTKPQQRHTHTPPVGTSQGHC